MLKVNSSHISASFNQLGWLRLRCELYIEDLIIIVGDHNLSLDKVTH